MAVLGLASLAMGLDGTVSVDYSTLAANDVLTVYGGGHSGSEFYAGNYDLEKTGGTGTGTTWPNGSLSGFCVELNEYAPIWPVTYNVVQTSSAYNTILGETFGTAKAGYLQELWGRYYDPAWTGSGSFTSTQNTKAAAFAAAVWEIVYEKVPTSPAQYNVTTTGSSGAAGFRVEGVDSILANTWLHSLNGTGPKAQLAVLTNAGHQDFLVAVPEPATLVLLGLGGAFSLIRRRRAHL
jgi:hypothetical protein